MICPNCNQPLRRNGIRNGIQQWRGHAPGCRKPGRSPIYDRPLTPTERKRRYLGQNPREIRYALFDQSKLPPDCLGRIHPLALVDVVVAPSWQQAIRDRPGCWAIPLGSLSKKEQDWVKKKDS